jgi:hypothetical protein
MRITSDRLKTLLLALYGAAILVTLWFYFLVPAPERWPFVIRALKSWPILFQG